MICLELHEIGRRLTSLMNIVLHIARIKQEHGGEEEEGKKGVTHPFLELVLLALLEDQTINEYFSCTSVPKQEKKMSIEIRLAYLP